MMIRLFALALLATASLFTAASPVTVTVTESISGQSDSIIRQNARVKAQYAGIERLPVVMSGHEQLTDTSFTTSIKAYLVGEVDVLTMGEVWDRKVGIYTLTAEVSLNRLASMEMIEGIRSNLALQKRLKSLYTSLDKLASASSISGADFADVHDSILSVKGRALVRDTIASSITAKEDFLAESYRFFDKRYMQPLLEKVMVEVTSIDESQVHYTVRLEIDYSDKREMEKYWSDNPERKAAFSKKRPDICFPGGDKMNILTQTGGTFHKSYDVYHRGNEVFASEPSKVIFPMRCRTIGR